MIKQPNMKMIGLFVLISALMVVALFGYFLKSKYSGNETIVVMYFNESIKGLDVGAPVLFKGVKIGEVSQIKLDANLKDMTFLIPVYANIYNRRAFANDDSGVELLDKLIDNGLRAQLSVNSVITGQLLIELDMYPDSKFVLKGESGQNEIPTINSPFAEFSKSLKVMPVAKIAQDIHHITQALNKDLPPLLNKMNTTLETVDEILIENKNNTAIMVEELAKAAQNVGGVAKSVNLVIDNNEQNIAEMIESFNEAARSMKNLTDYLEMYPNALITGKEY